jgi:DNA-binding transcriptional ArsR family regulator
MTDTLSATFAALADPTRRAILARLTQGPATINELAEPFEMTLPSVSRHVKVLEVAGLISKSRDAQFRPCKLEALPLEAADGWLAQYRQFFSARFDRLEDQIKVTMAERDRRKTTSEGDQ